MSAQRFWRNGAFFLWPLLLLSDTGGQLGLKLGSAAVAGHAFGPAWIWAAAGSIWVWAALGCYLCSFVLWMLILHRSDLSFAFPITALVYIAVLLACWLFLGEHVGFWRCAGVALIVAGVFLGGRGDRSPAGNGPP